MKVLTTILGYVPRHLGVQLEMAQWESEENENLIPACHLLMRKQAQSGKVSLLMWDVQLTADLK